MISTPKENMRVYILSRVCIGVIIYCLGVFIVPTLDSQDIPFSRLFPANWESELNINGILFGIK